MYVVIKVMLGRFVHYVGKTNQWEGLITNAKEYTLLCAMKKAEELQKLYPMDALDYKEIPNELN